MATEQQQSWKVPKLNGEELDKPKVNEGSSAVSKQKRLPRIYGNGGEHGELVDPALVWYSLRSIREITIA